ncbi:hypothetical protein ITP53_16710 [Nonomuraea sp. K274]|uniref:Uncharacterized protein n=1 Tax=Nonomuraea cypriaca TaxID=1187855 RepID=A0A931A9Y9_9ACTN|nr:hypothetical protein [Nonomuraea cypriaca]MBF8187344.1 hypothetical protein [Nonomuraea cypriaca]
MTDPIVRVQGRKRVKRSSKSHLPTRRDNHVQLPGRCLETRQTGLSTLMGRWGKDKPNLARRRTLTWTATSSTILLWTATVASALTGFGTDRLHATLLVGSFLAAVATMALLKMLFAEAQISRVSEDLRDTVHQAADEFHTAVEVLRQDRQAIVAMRTLAAELVAARQARQKQDQPA